jgi:multiple sugar transport system substrate-binding protein
MRKSLLLTVCVLVALALGLVAAQAQDEVTIEYWNINNEGFGGAVVDMLIENFEAANPGINVEARVQESYPALVQNLEAQIVAGNPPAIVQIGWPYLDYVYNNLPYVPVADLAAAYGGEDYLATFPDNVLALTDLGAGPIGMAYSLSNPVMYYNADVFVAAGLNPDEPPTTWEGWLEIAPALSEAADGKPVFNFGYGADNWILQVFTESAGGRMLVCEDGEFRTGLDSAEAAAGLQAWADVILTDQSINAGYAEATPAFIAGETVTYAYTIAGRGNIQSQVEFDLRATTFPQFGDNPVRLPAGGNFLSVFATDPAQQEAAWKWVQYLTSPEALTEWTKGLGYVPPLPGLTEDPAYLAEFVAETPIQQVAIDQLPSVVRWTSFPGANGLAAGEAAFRATQSALSGEQTAADALAAAAAEIDELIAGQPCAAAE